MTHKLFDSYNNGKRQSIIQPTIGPTLGAYLAIGFPSLLTKNFVKFHLSALNKKPPCAVLRKLNNGIALLPFTLILP